MKLKCLKYVKFEWVFLRGYLDFLNDIIIGRIVWDFWKIFFFGKLCFKCKDIDLRGNLDDVYVIGWIYSK